MMWLLVFLLALICSPTLSAKDFGVHGHTFEVIEPDLLEEIQNKLLHLKEEGLLQKHNEKLLEQAKKSLSSPAPVKGISRAKQARTSYYDPTLVVPYDLKDHEGRVFHKAGTRVNPFHHRSLSSTLIFIQGNDEEQVAWVENNYLSSDLKIKIILLSGSPFTLMDKWKRPVFFDQGGYISRKLGLQFAPALVYQEGLRLRIDEIVIEEDRP